MLEGYATVQETADADYYADDGEKAEEERYRYIGIDKLHR